MDPIGSRVSLRLADGEPDLTPHDVVRKWSTGFGIGKRSAFGSPIRNALRKAARDYDLPVGKTKLLLAEQGLWIAGDQVEDLQKLATQTGTSLRFRLIQRAISHARRMLTTEYALRRGQVGPDESWDLLISKGWGRTAPEATAAQEATQATRQRSSEIQEIATAASHHDFIAACLESGCQDPGEVERLLGWKRGKGYVVATRLRERWEKVYKKAC